MAHSLDMSQIKNLLKSVDKTKTEATMSSTYKERWPGERNLLILSKAVKKGLEVVSFRNGKLFRIKYVDADTVLVKPDLDFVPMGYFSRKMLKDVLEHGVDLDATE